MSSFGESGSTTNPERFGNGRAPASYTEAEVKTALNLLSDMSDEEVKAQSIVKGPRAAFPVNLLK